MDFLTLAADLGRVRKAHAAEFLFQRVMHSRTDGQAKAAADEKWAYELTMAEARYEIARHRLSHHTFETLEDMLRDDPHPDPDQEPIPAGPDPEGPGEDCGE